MTRSTLEATIADITAPVAASLGLALWGIEIAQASRAIVRIYIDGPEGVTIDQCADVSRHVGLALEVEEVFASAYVLEVSSPGLERPFFTCEQMAPYVGREIELTLADPHPEWPGRKKFRGVLHSVEEDAIVFVPDSAPRPDEAPAPLRAEWETVRKAHLVHVFPEPGHNKKPAR